MIATVDRCLFLLIGFLTTVYTTDNDSICHQCCASGPKDCNGDEIKCYSFKYCENGSSLNAMPKVLCDNETLVPTQSLCPAPHESYQYSEYYNVCTNQHSSSLKPNFNCVCLTCNNATENDSSVTPLGNDLCIIFNGTSQNRSSVTTTILKNVCVTCNITSPNISSETTICLCLSRTCNITSLNISSQTTVGLCVSRTCNITPPNISSQTTVGLCVSRTCNITSPNISSETTVCLCVSKTCPPPDIALLTIKMLLLIILPCISLFLTTTSVLCIYALRLRRKQKYDVQFRSVCSRHGSSDSILTDHDLRCRIVFSARSQTKPTWRVSHWGQDNVNILSASNGNINLIVKQGSCEHTSNTRVYASESTIRGQNTEAENLRLDSLPGSTDGPISDTRPLVDSTTSNLTARPYRDTIVYSEPNIGIASAFNDKTNSIGNEQEIIYYELEPQTDDL